MNEAAAEGWVLHADDTVDELLRCPICLLTLRDAVMCASEHKFGRACVQRHLEHSTECPLKCGRLRFHNLKPARLARGLVDRHHVSCVHEGCQDVHRVSEAESHRGACVHRQVACQDCGKQMPFRELEDHPCEDKRPTKVMWLVPVGGLISTLVSIDNTLVSGDMSGVLRIWRFGARDGEEPLNTRTHLMSPPSGAVLALAVQKDPCGVMVVIGSADKTVRVWHLGGVDTGHVIGTHSGNIT